MRSVSLHGASTSKVRVHSPKRPEIYNQGLDDALDLRSVRVWPWAVAWSTHDRYDLFAKQGDRARQLLAPILRIDVSVSRS